MKKLMLTAAVAASLAAPVAAQEADVAADPFLTTQGAALTGLAIIGGMSTLVLIAAGSSGDSTSGTD